MFRPHLGEGGVYAKFFVQSILVDRCTLQEAVSAIAKKPNKSEILYMEDSLKFVYFTELSRFKVSATSSLLTLNMLTLEKILLNFCFFIY